jgi:hypothetical protein
MLLDAHITSVAFDRPAEPQFPAVVMRDLNLALRRQHVGIGAVRQLQALKNGLRKARRVVAEDTKDRLNAKAPRH